MKLWVYISTELSDLIHEFSKIFEVDNLYRDYENVFEWIESRDLSTDLYLNISRPHDWETGNYLEPIAITIKSNSHATIDESFFAELIKTHFNCPVYAGEIHWDSNDHAVTKIQTTY